VGKKNSAILFLFSAEKKRFFKGIFSVSFNFISEKNKKKTVPQMVKSHPWAG
jgi:hypothetical protein